MAKPTTRPTTADVRVIPNYLSDEQAERAGAAIAADFGLKRAKGYTDRWQTESGTFTNKGIARRAHRILQEGV